MNKLKTQKFEPFPTPPKGDQYAIDLQSKVMEGNRKTRIDLDNILADLLKNSVETHAVTADYTILDDDGYGIIIVNPASGAKTITLPTLADNKDRVLTVKVSHSGGHVTIDGEGSEKIDGATTVVLGGMGDVICVIAGSSEWHILKLRQSFDTGWINCSDWTNRHLGSSVLTVADGSGFIEGEEITESTSGNTAIIAKKSTNTLYLKNVTGTGVFTATRTITGTTSAATSTVSTNTVNVDQNVYHYLSGDRDNMSKRLMICEDSTGANSVEVEGSDMSKANDYGYNVINVDSNQIKIHTASDGILKMNDSGVAVAIDTESWYYKIVISRAI